jgi:signal transduction histidine kinase
VLGAISDRRTGTPYWTLFGVGTAIFTLLAVGVALYLSLSVKAIRLNRRQSNFIDSVTHELKSPIASMKLYLQTLVQREVDPGRQRAFHETLLEDVERLDHLVNQVLDAGRVEAGGPLGDPEDLDLPAILEECASEACRRYDVGTEAVTLDLDPYSIRAAPAEVELLFGNLLDNAVKYAGDPPRVEVALHRERGGAVRVTVADNGRGIPPRMRRKVFARFVRVGSELIRDRAGTGLGLSIAQAAARRLGGDVRIRDRQPAPGAVFEVTLPTGSGGEGRP